MGKRRKQVGGKKEGEILWDDQIWDGKKRIRKVGEKEEGETLG
jgi:hypothetical protein